MSPSLNIGEIVVRYQKLVDRKIFIETQKIAAEFVVVKNIIDSEYRTFLVVENIKTTEIFTDYIESFRDVTPQEAFILSLTQILPELDGMF